MNNVNSSHKTVFQTNLGPVRMLGGFGKDIVNNAINRKCEKEIRSLKSLHRIVVERFLIIFCIILSDYH